MVKIILRKTERKDGTFPIVLSISKDRKTKVISSGIYCKKEHWSNGKLSKKHPNFVTRNRHLLKMQERALKIIDEFKLNEIEFTVDMIAEKFKGKQNSNISVSEFWLDKISDLEEAGRIGNAKAYRDTYRSFFKFTNNSKISFRQIDATLLSKYETYLRSTGNKDGGIGVKMRELRALFNDAIKKGVTKQEYYPFRHFKISKLKSSESKQALLLDEIKCFEELDIEKHPHLTNAYHYFLFSYYARGMNFQDMMLLQWKNIVGNRIQYSRSKTKKKFSISISKPMQEILDYYKGSNIGSSYIFPILLHNNLTPQQIANRKHKVLSRYNRRLKEIATVQNIDKTITSYVARHSFATNLKFLDVSTDKISQLMGHSNIEVTKAYLREFGDYELDKEVRKLFEEPTLKYA
jgi:site-specific recombinase XerD